MSIRKLLECLLLDGLERHRFLVDALPAEIVSLSGDEVVCVLGAEPGDVAAVEAHLALNGFEESEFRSGAYHFSALVSEKEGSGDAWRVTLRIQDQETELSKRIHDRLQVHNLSIVIQKPGSGEDFRCQAADLSSDGMAIHGDLPIQIGELLAITGIAEATGMPFSNPLLFQVKSLPNPRKAGLQFARNVLPADKKRWEELFLQLRQIQRFWQSLVESVRLKAGLVTRSGSLLSPEFACRQLKERPVPRRILIPDREFVAVSDSLNFLTRLDSIREEIENLLLERSKLESGESAHKKILLDFLGRLER